MRHFTEPHQCLWDSMTKINEFDPVLHIKLTKISLLLHGHSGFCEKSSVLDAIHFLKKWEISAVLFLFFFYYLFFIIFIFILYFFIVLFYAKFMQHVQWIHKIA